MRLDPSWLLCLVTLWTLSRVAGAESPITAQYGKNIILNCTFPSISGVKFHRLSITWEKEREKGAHLLVHKYYWRKDQLYRQEKDYKGRTQLFPDQFPEGNASLRLRSVRMQDEGSYLCSVNSELNSSFTRLPLLVIREIEEEEPIRTQCGRDVTLNCSFIPESNLQLLNITWRKGPDLVHSYCSQMETQDAAYQGRTQLFPERFHEVNASLRLLNVHLEDEGFYTCHIQPEHGRFSVRMRVTVEKAPENGHLAWLWFLLCVPLVPLSIYIALNCNPPLGQAGVCGATPPRRNDCLQGTTGNENSRVEEPGISQGGFEAGDHEKDTQNSREEDSLLGSKELLLQPVGDSTNISGDGNEESRGACGTGHLSDLVSGFQERNIALLGETGCGKSSFINAIRGLHDEDDDAACTGVVDTTKEIMAYQHPKHLNVRIWDMPGIKLEDFSLHMDIELSQCDTFLIFSFDDFTASHANIAQKIQQEGKTVYFVRSKVDETLRYEKKMRLQ